jgi:hypothetical protein
VIKGHQKFHNQWKLGVGLGRMQFQHPYPGFCKSHGFILEFCCSSSLQSRISLYNVIQFLKR